jgi:hypothetical protein
MSITDSAACVAIGADAISTATQNWHQLRPQIRRAASVCRRPHWGRIIASKLSARPTA